MGEGASGLGTQLEGIQPAVHLGRQKASAEARTISPPAVLARITGPLSRSVAEFVKDVASHYAISDGEQAPGISDGQHRAGMKRAAKDIARSQYEVYSFSTKHDLSEAATDELLELASNVSVVL